MPNTPLKRRPGRPCKSEIEAREEAFRRLDAQITTEHETYLEIDVSTPLIPNQTMLVDKVDYERFKSMLVGRFVARTTNSPANAMTPANIAEAAAGIHADRSAEGSGDTNQALESAQSRSDALADQTG